MTKMTMMIALGASLYACKPADQVELAEPGAQEEVAKGTEQAKAPDRTELPAEKVEDASKKEPMKKDAKKTEGDDRYIGMDLADAKALAVKEKRKYRVVSVDGKQRMVTMDYLPERLNFTVVAGKVTKVTRG
ncbi:hypothetical protein HW115_13375 [Verrucomicrobiaceae bacterium N1E253]|uniref:Uncharacterized protein n=1 Tax=Oceaniferula marina TaxID=2748318 RepID=A0A851GNJ6_9BACT|nr:hypothetical protein [Oceaniferula marina]NWK56607.1 hypothetical protein [Oceaniferula marina]